MRPTANQWLRDGLVEAYEQGMLGSADGGRDILGLSHDVVGQVVMQGGKRIAQKIVKVNSIDVVYEPIGGGKFIRMAAAAQSVGQSDDLEAQIIEAFRPFPR